MKNVHILPTDKQSKLYYWEGKLRLGDLTTAPKNLGISNQNIYITSDEEIKEGDYFIAYSVTIDKKPYISCASEYKERKKEKGKIILTTDVDLIKDGVQAIDDEFLEWFVKNPSCEEVEVIKYEDDNSPMLVKDKTYYYKIIIPKEEDFKHELHVMSKEEVLANRSNAYEFIDFDKQETLEETAERIAHNFEESSFKAGVIYGIIEGAKWQQERMYSEEDMKEAFGVGINVGVSDAENLYYLTFEEWFEQSKKK